MGGGGGGWGSGRMTSEQFFFFAAIIGLQFFFLGMCRAIFLFYIVILFRKGRGVKIGSICVLP